ncbi:hypothetical protein [Geothrix sp. PMB-07]|uniref:hypothetical protein n=1 Tax=Geothrix sp. PMB-07 TaxID=3068640 RepID=UPI00274250C6|nr:hypothetical protein [Geothrix sp. PMB-07]WLT29985.1 hypothetical protein Q9293_09685 [Geothrix sp. PMB-07]
MRQLSGPTFATCASCVYQVGEWFEHRDPDLDWSLMAHPEHLKYGYHEGAAAAEASNPADTPIPSQCSWRVG